MKSNFSAYWRIDIDLNPTVSGVEGGQGKGSGYRLSRPQVFYIADKGKWAWGQVGKMPSRATNISLSSRALLPNVITLKRYTCRQQPLVFGAFFNLNLTADRRGSSPLISRHLSKFACPPKCPSINIPTRPSLQIHFKWVCLPLPMAGL